MKRLSVLSLLILAASLLYSQSSVYVLPGSVAYGQEQFAAAGYDVVNIYPIGWSRDGKFAYVLWRDYIGSIGRCGDFKFIIRDLVTDGVVWSYDYFTQDETEFQYVWETCFSSIVGKLQKYKIVQQGFTVESFPYPNGSDSISIEIQANRTTDNTIRSFEVAAVSSRRGAKSLYQEPLTILESVEPAFCFRSPYEKRIAVVLIQTIPTMDGINAIVNPVVIGCHLEARFVR